MIAKALLIVLVSYSGAPPVERVFPVADLMECRGMIRQLQEVPNESFEMRILGAKCVPLDEPA